MLWELIFTAKKQGNTEFNDLMIKGTLNEAQMFYHWKREFWDIGWGFAIELCPFLLWTDGCWQ